MSVYFSQNPEFRSNQDFERDAQAKLDGYLIGQGWKTDRSGACKDFDAIYTTPAGVQHKAEEKFFRIEKAGDCFLFEVIQALEAPDWGWFVKTPSRILVYALCLEDGTPSRIWMLDWPQVKRWFLTEYLPHNKAGKFRCVPDGYGVTINLLVPTKNVPPQMYRFFKV